VPLSVDSKLLRSLGKFLSFASQGLVLSMARYSLNASHFEYLLLYLSLVTPLTAIDLGLKSYIYALPRRNRSSLLAALISFFILLLFLACFSGYISHVFLLIFPSLSVDNTLPQTTTSTFFLYIFYLSFLRSTGEIICATFFHLNKQAILALSDIISFLLLCILILLSLSAKANRILYIYPVLSTAPILLSSLLLLIPFLVRSSKYSTLFKDFKNIFLFRPSSLYHPRLSLSFFILQLSVIIPSYLTPLLYLPSLGPSLSANLRVCQIISSALLHILIGYYYHILKEASETHASPTLDNALSLILKPLSISSLLVASSVLSSLALLILSLWDGPALQNILIILANSITFYFMFLASLISLYFNGRGKPLVCFLAFLSSTLVIILASLISQRTGLNVFAVCGLPLSSLVSFIILSSWYHSIRLT